jgi:hypothetical protein
MDSFKWAIGKSKMIERIPRINPDLEERLFNLIRTCDQGKLLEIFQRFQTLCFH